MSSLIPHPAPTAALSAPALGSRRISRADIAKDHIVWVATCAMVWIFWAAQLGVLLLMDSSPRQLGLVVFVGVYALTITRSEPPAVDSLANQALLATLSAGVVAAMCGPGGPTGLIGAVFIGPLFAARIDDRRWLAAQLLAFSFAAWVIGGVSAAELVPFASVPMSLTMMLVGLAAPVLGFSCMVVLEAAEKQGDELERLVRRDVLTGIGNRRLMLEVLEAELARHERGNRALSVLVLDLNAFKALNDEHGHAVGDDLLRDVAGALRTATPPASTLVRQGGDEFCVILPETAALALPPTANAIRAALAQAQTPNGPITAGIGWATYPDDATSVDVLLHVADERLRANKPESRRSATSGDRPSNTASRRSDSPEPRQS